MRLIRKLLRFILFLIVIISTVIIAGGYGKYRQAIGQMPIEKAVEKIRSTEDFTPFSEISHTFVKAMVAVEDRRFYKHRGIDFIGIGRAIKINFEKKELSQGGSGITQQLAKNMYFMHDDSLSRKVAEMMIAVSLEKQFSKEEILELYFNVIYYGSGYYSIGEAALGYFGKTPSELSDYEATLLAGIPNAPSVYSPKKNPSLAKKRQKTVIKAMIDMKYLTKEEAEAIIAIQ